MRNLLHQFAFIAVKMIRVKHIIILKSRESKKGQHDATLESIEISLVYYTEEGVNFDYEVK